MTNPALWITVMVIVAAGTVALIRFGYFVENVLRKKHPTWVGHLPVTLLTRRNPARSSAAKLPPRNLNRQREWVGSANQELGSALKTMPYFLVFLCRSKRSKGYAHPAHPALLCRLS